MFFQNYIIEPLKYGLSDFSKLLKGGIFYGLGILLLFSGIFMAIYPYMGMNFQLSITSGNLLFGLISLVMSIIAAGLLIIVNGYILKLIKVSIEQSTELPEWTNYGKMLKEGFVFSLGVAVIAIFGIILQNAITFIGNGNLVLVLISILVQVIVSLYIPLSTVNYAKEGNFGAFFDISKILKKMSIEYIGVILVVSIISTILVIIPMVLVMIPIMAFLGPMGFMGQRTIFAATPILLVVSMFAFIVFSIVTFYTAIYSYRAYTNYFISKNSDQADF